MFSRRLTWSPAGNPLSEALGRALASGRPLLDLTVSNPTRVGLPYPPELAAALVDATTDYGPEPLGLPSARAAVASELGVDADRVVLTASSSESYAFLWKLLCDPGDVVLVPAPSYPLFEYLAALEGVHVRPYRLVYDGRWHVDFANVDFTGVRAVVLVNPNNPTGHLIERGDLDRLARLAADAGVALVVDEVFRDYVALPPADAVPSVLTRALPCLSFVLGGLSKSCGLPQLKLGWIVIHGPAELAQQARDRLELIADTYLSVGGPVQRALPDLLALGRTIREAITARVSRNAAALARAFAPPSPATVLPRDGGWSAIVRLPAVTSDEAWAIDLVERQGVHVQPGYFYDLDLGAAIVVSLLPEPTTFDEGLARIAQAVADVTPGL